MNDSSTFPLFSPGLGRGKIVAWAGLLFFGLFTYFYLYPAFRGEIAVPSGFSVGPLTIRYYGLILAGAVLLCWWLAYRLASRFGIEKNLLDNVLFWSVIGGIFGARVLVVLEQWSFFKSNFWEIFKIWHGGLAIYGAILGTMLAVYVLAKKSRFEFLKMLDLMAIVTPLGQTVGRWGNFFNQEAFGPPTDILWKMHIDAQHRPLAYLSEQFFHPTFLYESLWNLAVFVLLWYLIKRGFRSGTYLGLYLMLYSLGRFFLEYLRVDSFLVSSLRLNQLLSLGLIIAGILVIIFSRIKYAKGI